MIDEYDFYEARYSGEGTEPAPEVRIEVVLTGLSAGARRFQGRLRPWNSEANDFALPPGDDVTELAAGEWCLPVVFLGRFDRGR